jgi:hypothetical protein
MNATTYTFLITVLDKHTSERRVIMGAPALHERDADSQLRHMKQLLNLNSHFTVLETRVIAEVRA